MIDIGLARLLADGSFHSGEVLGRELGLSRAGVWNRIEVLRVSGVVVDSVTGKGYRIPGGLDLLDADVIGACLEDSARAHLGAIEVLSTTGSTNDVVMTRLRQGDTRCQAVLAEQQTAGRGRRGRSWASPFAANIYLSVSWEFAGGLAALDGLSLAVGVALCEALADCGLENVGLKWPNDLVVNEHKLGGILIEASGEAGGACSVVVGVGINVRMPPLAISIDQPWTDLHTLGLRAVSRNRLAAAILSRLCSALVEFSHEGFSGFGERWRMRDVIAGKRIEVLLGANRIAGVAAGVDRRGALLVDTADGRQTFHGGEISVRGAA